MRGALLLVALMSFGCPGPADPVPEPVLATVGDATIGVDHFLEAARVRAQAAEFPRSGAGFEQLRDRIVQELIVQEVLIAEAEARGIAVTADEVAAARSAAADPIVEQEGDREEFERMLQERFGDPVAHERVLRRRLLTAKVEAALREELRAGIGVTDEQVAAAMDRFARLVVQPARVHCRQIFLESADAARDVRRRLAEGEAFDALAQEHNGSDGDMGWVAASSMPPMLASAIEGLPVGKTSKIVRSPLGYHVFQLLGRSPAAPLPEPEARAVVERSLIDETVEVRFRGWVGSRTDELAPAVEEEALAALRCCRQGLPYLGEAPPES